MTASTPYRVVGVHRQRQHPAFDTGDRVAAAEPLGGGFFRPRVATGTRGIVIRVLADGRMSIAFSNGRVCEASPGQLAMV